MICWDLVIDVFEPTSKPKSPPASTFADRNLLRKTNYDMFGTFDYVPPSLPISHGRAKLCILEDNDAVIKMATKELSSQLRHVARTRRVDLDCFLRGSVETLVFF